MLSGIGNAEELRGYGIPVVSNLPGVGENLQDHCFVVGFVGETKAPMAPGSRAGSHLFFRSIDEAYSPNVHALLATAAIGIIEVKPNEAFSIRLGLLRPQSRGRIKITSADLDAPLLIDPNYLSASADLSALCAAVEHSRAIGLAAGLSEWRKKEIARIPHGKNELNEFVARNVGSYWHPVGTCAMGTHDLAVVDPSLRVYGTTNLRLRSRALARTSMRRMKPLSIRLKAHRAVGMATRWRSTWWFTLAISFISRQVFRICRITPVRSCPMSG
jgi:choline dehydrogenase